MGYTLIITEKPSASERIANALADGEIEKKVSNKVAYYKITRGGKDIVISSAVGHLFILTEDTKTSTWTYPSFAVKWTPTYLDKNNVWSKKYFDNMKRVGEGATEFISACDFDIEGSTIAYNIMRFIFNLKDGKRMKFSTLTKEELINAYENASEHLDFPQIEAGLTRHQIDWYFGINITRALTLALEHSGGYWILSTGRVQGPTLSLLKSKQQEIKNFKPKPFWEIELATKIKDSDIIAKHVEDKFWEKSKADSIVAKIKGKKEGVIDSVEKKEQKQMPPFPFDLTTLQREAYNIFGYSPKQTLDIAQSLYEQAVISYPRTSSQKLPAKLGFQTILKKLSSQLEYHDVASKLLAKKFLKPNEGKKSDPAHPAIYPTGVKPKQFNSYQKKLYDLIVKRFFAVFGDPAVREMIKMLIDVNGEIFVVHGARTIKANWIEFYKPYAKFKDVILPDVKKGDNITIKKLDLLDKETQPPSRYTQASILKDMEKLGLGTKSTRAQILETLYDRGYIKEKSIIVTELGEAVINALDKYCSEITSPELTKQMEENMESVENGTKKREEILSEVEKNLRTILSKFKENEKAIGKGILEAVKQLEKTRNNLGNCPKCTQNMRIIHSKRTKKRFVGCSNYPKCHNSYPLPQNGNVTVLSKTCPTCGLFLVSIKSKGKRPWRLCVKCGFEKSKEKAAKGKIKKAETKTGAKTEAKPDTKTEPKTKSTVKK
ncbi:MAG: DNA topoisomerase I [Candidatus Aenigmatarchaeota archaeon]